MRFFGKVGFGESVESSPGSGAFNDVITEREYQGDVPRNFGQLSVGDTVTGTIAVNNTISIVADGHALRNYLKIAYVEWEGVRWTVTSVEVRQPRLILSLGEVYNGPTP